LERSERVPSGNKNALLLAVRAALDGHQAGVWTALPAFVQSFNAAHLTVECQPTIQPQVRQPDGTWIDVTLPLCVDCPVMFPGGGGFVLTFPLVAGNEGLLVFASRCIDSWWQNGGVQKQAEIRMHDLSDGFFIPTGGMSNAKVPGNVSTTSTQLRSSDGLTSIDLSAEHVITLTAPSGIVLNGPLSLLSTVSGQSTGATGSFTTPTGQVVTVQGGVITNIY
jgi:Phage protein Gp138 N-terminal domain